MTRTFARKITMPLATRESDRLKEISEQTGLDETHVLHRAINLYWYIRWKKRSGLILWFIDRVTQRGEALVFPDPDEPKEDGS